MDDARKIFESNSPNVLVEKFYSFIEPESCNIQLFSVEKIFSSTGETMEKLLYYVMLIERGKLYNQINKEMVIKHVEYIKKLDCNGQLILCGPLKGYKGVAGMIIIKANNFEEAKTICNSEPFVAEGYATYKLVTLQVGNKDNNYLL
jgi:uncharacterized protein YciI